MDRFPVQLRDATWPHAGRFICGFIFKGRPKFLTKYEGDENGVADAGVTEYYLKGRTARPGARIRGCPAGTSPHCGAWGLLGTGEGTWGVQAAGSQTEGRGHCAAG